MAAAPARTRAGSSLGPPRAVRAGVAPPRASRSTSAIRVACAVRTVPGRPSAPPVRRPRSPPRTQGSCPETTPAAPDAPRTRTEPLRAAFPSYPVCLMGSERESRPGGSVRVCGPSLRDTGRAAACLSPPDARRGKIVEAVHSRAVPRFSHRPPLAYGGGTEIAPEGLCARARGIGRPVWSCRGHDAGHRLAPSAVRARLCFWAATPGSGEVGLH